MVNKYQSGRYALHVLVLSEMEPMRKTGSCTVVNRVLPAGSVVAVRLRRKSRNSRIIKER